MHLQQLQTTARAVDSTRLRKFDRSDEDYAAICAIDNAVWPEYLTKIENWKHWDKTRDAKYRFQRWLLERDGRVVAFGACGDRHWAHKPGHYFIDIAVYPGEEGHGYGSLLYNHFLNELQRMEPACVQITTNTREDKPRGIRFLQARGFKQVMRFPRSLLDVTHFDPSPFAQKLAQTRQSGMEIKTLAEIMAQDPDWLHKLYDLEWELVQDVPYHDELTQQSYESFEKSMLGHPNLFPEAYFIAVDGQRWAGLSALWRNPGDAKRLETGLTGVARAYRRRGLATAMKVTAIEFAKSLGVTEIETDNEEHNPMYGINMQLGYVPQPAYLDFVKEVVPQN